jgi:pimeloyl-ACP methyl ester carboxylesterase
MVDNISHTHMKFLTLLLAACVGAAAESLASETSVHVEGPSGILRGTMLSPAAGPGAPTVLIIPGSGPTDRDGNNPLGIRAAPYRFLAEALAGRGVTTLRFDKRGLFGSSAAARDANDVRMSDYAADVRAWMTAAQKWTTAPCAWIAGHSEGSLVALVAAQQPDGICGLILIAGAGRRLGNVLRDQLRANPANAPIVPQALAAIGELEAGKRVDVDGLHPALRGLFRPAVQGFVIDQMSYDPVTLLAAYAGPVLVLQGTTDLQVSMQDAENLRGARSNVTFVALEGVNHVLKVASAGRSANLATYGDPKLPIAVSVVDAIDQFLNRAR